MPASDVSDPQIAYSEKKWPVWVHTGPGQQLSLKAAENDTRLSNTSGHPRYYFHEGVVHCKPEQITK